MCWETSPPGEQTPHRRTVDSDMVLFSCLCLVNVTFISEGQAREKQLLCQHLVEVTARWLDLTLKNRTIVDLESLPVPRKHHFRLSGHHAEIYATYYDASLLEPEKYHWQVSRSLCEDRRYSEPEKGFWGPVCEWKISLPCEQNLFWR